MKISKSAKEYEAQKYDERREEDYNAAVIVAEMRGWTVDKGVRQ